MTIASKPERADVCIIGAGATGATAAKVLTEAGRHVVALEKGPWRTRETFGGDELANVNRYNLWPDPQLNPRPLWRGYVDTTEYPRRAPRRRPPCPRVHLSGHDRSCRRRRRRSERQGVSRAARR